MREGSPGLVTEDIGEVLQADLDLLGGLIVVGKVGGVAPCLLFWRGRSEEGVAVGDDDVQLHAPEDGCIPSRNAAGV